MNSQVRLPIQKMGSRWDHSTGQAMQWRNKIPSDWQHCKYNDGLLIQAHTADSFVVQSFAIVRIHQSAVSSYNATVRADKGKTLMRIAHNIGALAVIFFTLQAVNVRDKHIH